jgi:hypothetical protein
MIICDPHGQSSLSRAEPFPHVRFPAFSNEIGRDLPASVRFLARHIRF